MRQKVKSALVYPIIVLGMAVVVVLVLTLFVLPRFETFFESFHAKLPLPTRMLLSVAHFMGHWGWLIVAIIVGVGHRGGCLLPNPERSCQEGCVAAARARLR